MWKGTSQLILITLLLNKALATNITISSNSADIVDAFTDAMSQLPVDAEIPDVTSAGTSEIVDALEDFNSQGDGQWVWTDGDGGPLSGHYYWQPNSDNQVGDATDTPPINSQTTTNGVPVDSANPVVSSGGDQDNDVPMLTNIYQRLNSLDQDNDNELLQQILEELKGGETPENAIDPEKIDGENYTIRSDGNNAEVDAVSEGLLPTKQTLTETVTQGWSSETVTAPSMQVGQHTVSFDYTGNPLYNVMFTLAKSCITAVGMFGIIFFTFKTSLYLLSF